MTREQLQSLVETARSGYAPRPRQTVADWCVENLRFDEPTNRGPYSLAGRAYSREILDAFADDAVTDLVPVCGSQIGKTAMVMGGCAWTIANDPSRVFWVMPTRDTVRSFSRTRWMPMVRASKSLPLPERRHDFATLQQDIGSSHVDFIWSNSPSALASVPARLVILDEVDKFNSGGKAEANAVDLADQRTKGQSRPKRVKTSTPTLLEGLIWQEFLKTDQRRRFVPCPHCGKFVVLAWSPTYTVMAKTGSEAYVRWDQEARTATGWDLDRVAQSARFECPHCRGHINDAHKTLIDRQGEWRPTATAARGYRGWHLPSLYSCRPECNVGRLAVKFLQAKASLLGLQGFINGDLAEPYMAQDTLGQRVEMIRQRVEISEDAVRLLTVDVQAKGPTYFWAAARAWKDGNSAGLAARGLETWEQVRAMQEEFGVRDVCVLVDSGWGAKSDAEVYRECTRYGEREVLADGKEVHLGWMPAKGQPGRKRWKDENGLHVPYVVRPQDPYAGTTDAGRVTLDLFEFSADTMKDMLDAMRHGKGGWSWSVQQDMATDIYWRHMDAEVLMPVFNRVTGVTHHRWQPRSRHWPNHLFDCEVMQVALAMFLGLFKYEETTQ